MEFQGAWMKHRRNNYASGVFNGDIEVIQEIDLNVKTRHPHQSPASLKPLLKTTGTSQPGKSITLLPIQGFDCRIGYNDRLTSLLSQNGHLEKMNTSPALPWMFCWSPLS